MANSREGAFALAFSVAFSFLISFGGLPASALAGAQDYRFELVGQPQPGPAGKSIVSVRLVHVPNAKPVSDAVLFDPRADMGPAGMPTMTAPIKPAPGQVGVYRFEVEAGMTGKWAISLAAKVQGEVETVRGSITTDLVK